MTSSDARTACASADPATPDSINVATIALRHAPIRLPLPSGAGLHPVGRRPSFIPAPAHSSRSAAEPKLLITVAIMPAEARMFLGEPSVEFKCYSDAPTLGGRICRNA